MIVVESQLSIQCDDDPKLTTEVPVGVVAHVDGCHLGAIHQHSLVLLHVSKSMADKRTVSACLKQLY
jgi:hypothetical protein